MKKIILVFCMLFMSYMGLSSVSASIVDHNRHCRPDYIRVIKAKDLIENECCYASCYTNVVHHIVELKVDVLNVSSDMYIDEIKTATSIWNEYHNFFVVNSDYHQAIYVNMYSLDSENVIAIYDLERNEITLSEEYFINLTYEQRVKVLVHELGHVLGFNDIPSCDQSISVMVQGLSEDYHLSELDIKALEDLFNNNNGGINSETME